MASVPNPSRLALPAALALLVLSSLLCLGVLAAPRSAALSEADRLAVLGPLASFSERHSAYVDSVSAVPVDAVTLRAAQLRDGSTVELRVSEGATDVLFAVAPSDSVSTVTVERASVCGSDSLGLFLGHGVERGDTLWCAYSLDALPADPSDLSAVVRCVYPDGFEHVLRWGGWCRMTLDALRRSPLFAPLGERLRARNVRALSDGVPVTAASGGGVSPMRFALRFGAFVSLVASLALSPLPDALSIAPALAFLALAWFVLALFLFRSDFRIGIPAATDSLMGFIRSARLYTEEKVLDENRRDTGMRRIVDSVRLVYFLEYPMLRVRALDDVAWHKAVGELDALGLPAALGLPLDSKVSAVTHTDYLFRIVEDERIRAVPRLLPSAPAFTGVRDAVPLTGSLSWRFSKLPHMLVAGGTGGGKSTFIYYLLGEFLRLGDADGGAGDVFICDPKNAELASLSCVFGTDRVGVSPAQIAGVVRRCREEMDRRYAYMQDPARFRFGASAFDYGLPPVFLIFDEVAAFKAAADSKTFAEVWGNLTQLVLKARAANVFVILAMQQPRADTISTDIRDNLGARVSLGNLSAEGYRMCFGGGFADYQTVTERGTGYIMLDGWDAPRPFKAPFADYSGIDYPKELKRLYIASRERNGAPLGVDGGESPERPSDI